MARCAGPGRSFEPPAGVLRARLMSPFGDKCRGLVPAITDEVAGRYKQWASVGHAALLERRTGIDDEAQRDSSRLVQQFGCRAPVRLNARKRPCDDLSDCQKGFIAQ